jgi:putative sensory transduction regulator
MALTPETLEGYFEQYGWTYQKIDDAYFRTVFRGDVSSFVIHVRIAGDWVYFSVAPFVVTPQDTECERKLYGHLLKLNHEINMAKFTVDSDGDIVLTVELPGEHLDYSEFSDALGALSYYADDNYTRVFVLAHMPEAHAIFEDGQDLDWGTG